MSTTPPTLASLPDDDRSRIIEACRQFGRDIETDNVDSIETQLAGWDGERLTILLRELLLVELLNRRRKGETPTRDEYRARFTESAEVVDSVFDLLDGDDAHDVDEFESTLLSGDFGSTIIQPLPADTDIETIVDTAEPQDNSDATRVDPSAGESNDPTELETLIETDQSDPFDIATMDQTTDVLSQAPGKQSRPTGSRGSLPPDYELIGVLGKGGMGLVYKARQKRADRIVALKVIRPEKLSGMSTGAKDRAIERFQTEAQAAGRLQHDNLVMVYDVGEFDGCHYFSMQFVDGQSLSEVMRDGPLEDRQAAEYIEPICRAVHFAHEQGILHRDIKPQNILIEQGTQRPRIADFGLAKIIDADIEMTRAGESMGTPPYMPPEQFGDAAKVTAAADVYGLGATLYHLLSGRPPFQAATALTTMRQVIEKDPVPLQELNSAVDKDLETICMKCLEKEPNRRYASAGDMADELKRYLNGQPILARPLGPASRFWRWCRRNPVVSSLSGAVVAAIFVSVVSLAVANVKTEEARQLSEASFQDALGAVNDFFTRVSEDRLLNEEGFQVLRRDLLEMAREYYGRLIERRSDDPTLAAEVADSHFRLGLITEELDTAQAAQATYDKALALQRELCRAQPDSKERREALSKTINALGRLATRAGDYETARQHFDETLELRESLVQETENAGERFEYDRLLANGWMNIGLLHGRQQELDQALELMTTAQDYRQRVLPVDLMNRKMRRDLAKGWYNLANLGVDRADAKAVETNIVKAIRELEQLLKEDSEDLRDRYMLSQCYGILADLQAVLSIDDPDLFGQTIENYSKAITALRDLTGRNPAVPRYRNDMAQVLLNLGQFEAEWQQIESSRARIEEAEALLKVLVDEVPDNVSYSETLSLATQMLEALRGL